MAVGIGDLFVNLGIKGSEKTLGALSATKEGLAATGSTALETKAAILAAVYAFGRLMETSGKLGTSLTNFNALSGGLAQTLQKYQYVGKQVGVTAQEMEGSFSHIRQSMTEMIAGGAAPIGWQELAKKMGFTAANAAAFIEHPEQLIQALQGYAQLEHNVGLRERTIKSFVPGENMGGAIVRNAFTPGLLSKAPTFSDKELSSLTKADAAWERIADSVEKAFGHFNAAHGAKIAADLEKIIKPLERLAEQLLKIADRAKVFQAISDSMRGWAEMLSHFDKFLDPGKETYGPAPQSVWGGVKKDFNDAISSVARAIPPPIQFAASQLPGATVNQTNNFYGNNGDPAHIKQSTKDSVRGLNNAVRQTPQGRTN